MMSWGESRESFCGWETRHFIIIFSIIMAERVGFELTSLLQYH